MMAAQLAPWRTAAVYIDCPRPNCGGGVEGSDGSFMLDQSNVPDVKPGRTVACDECSTRFRIPRAPLRALGIS